MRQSIFTSLLAALPLTLAAPKQPEFTNTTTLPTHFGLLLFPHFQALDVFGPMDVINTLFLLYGNSTAPTHLSILSRTLEPVSTLMKGMHGRGDFGQSIVPTITIKDYMTKYGGGLNQTMGDGKGNKGNCTDGKGGHLIAKRHDGPHDGPMHVMPTMPAMPEKDWGEIEVLFVPGGGGTRQDMSEEIALVKSMYPKLKYIVSICTGATILSRAGILDGKRATTNKRAWPWATSTGPNVNWVPTARWVEDGNIFSSAGISAGIDATYAWVARVYGEDVADYLSVSAEYPREKNWQHDPFAKIWDVPGST